MRNLSNYEKEIVKYISNIKPKDIIDGKKFVLDNFFSLEKDILLLWLPNMGEKAILYIKGKKDDTCFTEKLQKFLELISIIEDLKIERYLNNFEFKYEKKIN